MSEAQLSILEQLAELEAMLRGLTLAALKLPPGPEKRDNLLAIGRFRRRIAALKQSELATATILHDLRRSA